MPAYKELLKVMYDNMYIMRDIALYAYDAGPLPTIEGMTQEAHHVLKTPLGKATCVEFVEAFRPAAATIAALEHSTVRPIPTPQIEHAISITSTAIAAFVSRLQWHVENPGVGLPNMPKQV